MIMLRCMIRDEHADHDTDGGIAPQGLRFALLKLTEGSSDTLSSLSSESLNVL